MRHTLIGILSLALMMPVVSNASPLGCLMDFFSYHGIPRKESIDGQAHPLDGYFDTRDRPLKETLGYASPGLYGYAIFADEPVFLGFVDDGPSDPSDIVFNCGCTVLAMMAPPLFGDRIHQISGLCSTLD